MKILPTITVTGAINCRDLIKEARLLGLTEVAFFPTMINKEERFEAYKLMKEAGITKIP